MKLTVNHSQGENSISTLSLKYVVPVLPSSYCMSVYDDRKDVSSLHHHLEIDGKTSKLPSQLTLEKGDNILLLNERQLTVKIGFQVEVELGFHEAFLFEIVSYFIAGSYLNREKEDPDFFRSFKETFTLHKPESFTHQEIEKHVLTSESFGDTIEDYCHLDSKTRQTFLSRIQ